MKISYPYITISSCSTVLPNRTILQLANTRHKCEIGCLCGDDKTRAVYSGNQRVGQIRLLCKKALSVIDIRQKRRDRKDICLYYRTFRMELTSYAVVRVFTQLRSANKLKLRYFYLKSMIASETGARTVSTGEGGARHLFVLSPPPVPTLKLRVFCACLHIYISHDSYRSIPSSLTTKFTLEDLTPEM